MRTISTVSILAIVVFVGANPVGADPVGADPDAAASRPDPTLDTNGGTTQWIKPTRAAAKKEKPPYLCDQDRDKDRDVDGRDVALCLDLARDSLTDADDGNDNAVEILLPQGEFDICNTDVFECPFELVSGMNISGVMPRLRVLPAPGKDIADVGPDLDMRPNGGTWLTTGDACQPTCGTDIFTGRKIRGLILERIGFRNYDVAIELGGDNVGGASFSRLQDLFFVGGPVNDSSDTAIKIYNFQHIRGDHINVHDSKTGLHLINLNDEWQGGNSVFSDVYVNTYPNPPGGIILEAAGGPSYTQLNYLTFIRPQVNAFPGTQAPGSTNIYLKGTTDNIVQGISLIEVDIEGKTEYGIKVEGTFNSSIELVGVATSLSMQASVLVDEHSRNNVFVSSTGNATLELGGAPPTNHNHFLGNWIMADGSRIFDHPAIKGSVRDVAFNRAIGKYDHVDIAGAYDLAAPDAVRIAVQASGDWNSGNLRMLGGGSTTGHVRLGGTHLWAEGAGRLRVRGNDEGPPDGEDDGHAVVTGTGSVARGVTLWGDANDPASDSGEALCAASGLTCLAVVIPGTGEELDCATASSSVGGYFFALCY